jgi:hypothetical protein
MRWFNYIRRRAGAAMLLAAGLMAVPAGAETIKWKPVSNGVVKVNGGPVKKWDLLLSSQRKGTVLLQLGARFLLVDVAAQEVQELGEETLERRAGELRWTPAKGSLRKLLASDEWSERDVGRARIIQFRLTGEGRRFEVQVPVAPDLRKLY